jgi:uncharacterized membrane protein
MANLLRLHANHASSESLAVQAPGTHAMEHWISYVLRAGVLISAAVILVGGMIFFIRGAGPSDPHSMHQLLNGEYANRASFDALLRGLRRGRGTAYADIGLLLLILTPVIRVAMTFVLFLLQKDWFFTTVTGIVFVILILGVSGLAF